MAFKQFVYSTTQKALNDAKTAKTVTDDDIAFVNEGGVMSIQTKGITFPCGYSKAEADDRYLKLTGGTLTGDLFLTEDSGIVLDDYLRISSTDISTYANNNYKEYFTLVNDELTLSASWGEANKYWKYCAGPDTFNYQQEMYNTSTKQWSDEYIWLNPSWYHNYCRPDWSVGEGLELISTGANIYGVQESDDIGDNNYVPKNSFFLQADDGLTLFKRMGSGTSASNEVVAEYLTHMITVGDGNVPNANSLCATAITINVGNLGGTDYLEMAPALGYSISCKEDTDTEAHVSWLMAKQLGLDNSQVMIDKDSMWFMTTSGDTDAWYGRDKAWIGSESTGVRIKESEILMGGPVETNHYTSINPAKIELIADDGYTLQIQSANSYPSITCVGGRMPSSLLTATIDYSQLCPDILTIQDYADGTQYYNMNLSYDSICFNARTRATVNDDWDDWFNYNSIYLSGSKNCPINQNLSNCGLVTDAGIDGGWGGYYDYGDAARNNNVPVASFTVDHRGFSVYSREGSGKTADYDLTTFLDSQSGLFVGIGEDPSLEASSGDYGIGFFDDYPTKTNFYGLTPTGVKLYGGSSSKLVVSDGTMTELKTINKTSILGTGNINTQDVYYFYDTIACIITTDPVPATATDVKVNRVYYSSDNKVFVCNVTYNYNSSGYSKYYKISGGYPIDDLGSVVIRTKVADGSVQNSTPEQNNIYINQSTGVSYYTTTSSTLAACVPSAGSVTNAKLASSAVTSTKLADNAVTTAKIADRSVTSNKLAKDIEISTLAAFTLEVDEGAVNVFESGNSATDGEIYIWNGGVKYKLNVEKMYELGLLDFQS